MTDNNQRVNEQAHLLPCPFCAADMIEFGPAQFNHPGNECWLATVKVGRHEFAAWNRRAAIEQRAASAPAEWISINDRLPPNKSLPNGDCMSVFALWKDGYFADCLHQSEVTNTAYFHKNIEKFTHWMPIPPLPGQQAAPEAPAAASVREDRLAQALERLLERFMIVYGDPACGAVPHEVTIARAALAQQSTKEKPCES